MSIKNENGCQCFVKIPIQILIWNKSAKKDFNERTFVVHMLLLNLVSVYQNPLLKAPKGKKSSVFALFLESCVKHLNI